MLGGRRQSEALREMQSLEPSTVKALEEPDVTSVSAAESSDPASPGPAEVADRTGADESAEADTVSQETAVVSDRDATSPDKIAGQAPVHQHVAIPTAMKAVSQGKSIIRLPF